MLLSAFDAYMDSYEEALAFSFGMLRLILEFSCEEASICFDPTTTFLGWSAANKFLFFLEPNGLPLLLKLLYKEFIFTN